MDLEKRKAGLRAWQAGEKGQECKVWKEQGEGEVRTTELLTALSLRWGLQLDVALDEKQMNYSVYVGTNQNKRKWRFFSSRIM